MPESFEIQASPAVREELAKLKARLARAKEALYACRPGNMMNPPQPMPPPSPQPSTRSWRSQYAGEGMIGAEEGVPSVPVPLQQLQQQAQDWAQLAPHMERMASQLEQVRAIAALSATGMQPAVQPLTGLGVSRPHSSPSMRRSEEKGECERRLLRTRLSAKYPPQSAGACGMTIIEVAWREAESRAREELAKAQGQCDGQVTLAGDSQQDGLETKTGGTETRDRVRFVLIKGASERLLRQENALKHSTRSERRASRQERAIRTEHEESRLMANVVNEGGFLGPTLSRADSAKDNLLQVYHCRDAYTRSYFGFPRQSSPAPHLHYFLFDSGHCDNVQDERDIVKDERDNRSEELQTSDGGKLEIESPSTVVHANRFLRPAIGRADSVKDYSLQVYHRSQHQKSAGPSPTELGRKVLVHVSSSSHVSSS